MSRAVKILKTLPRTILTRFSTKGNAANGEIDEGYKRFKLKQQHFQKPDGKPIFLKGGPMDKVLFLSTLGLCGFGLLSAFVFIFGSAFPKKPKVMPLPEPIVEEIIEEAYEEPEVVQQSFFSQIGNFFQRKS